MAWQQNDPGNKKYLARFLEWLGRLGRCDLGLAAGRQPCEPVPFAVVSDRIILLLTLDRWAYGPLAQQLEESGFTTRVVRESVAALDILSREDPALLIVVGPADLDLYRALRQASPVPILALAPHADEDQTLSAFAAGVDQFQAGFISPGEVVARVCALLRRGT